MGFPVLSHSDLLESPSLTSPNQRPMAAPGHRNRHPEDAAADRWFRRCLRVTSRVHRKKLGILDGLTADHFQRHYPRMMQLLSYNGHLRSFEAQMSMFFSTFFANFTWRPNFGCPDHPRSTGFGLHRCPWWSSKASSHTREMPKKYETIPCAMYISHMCILIILI